MKLELVATCLFGLEHLLGEEIDALGYERISTIDGRVTFAGDEQAVALCIAFGFDMAGKGIRPETDGRNFLAEHVGHFADLVI